MQKQILKKGNSGITLIALVITIIVLLILAGVVIATLTGENGILNRAGDASVDSELAQIEEQANIIYMEKMTNTNSSGNITLAEVVEELTAQGYDVQSKTTGGGVTGITLSSSSVKIEPNGTATIVVSYDEATGESGFYAVVQGNYYLMQLGADGIRINRTATEIVEGETPELTATSNNGNVEVQSINGSTITLLGVTTGSSTVTISYGTYSQICEITVESKLASEVLQAGDYVNYNGQKWRVLYDKAYNESYETNYGVQMVSLNSIGEVSLGAQDPATIAEDKNIETTGKPGTKGTFERAKWSFNNAITTLNVAADNCRAKDANGNGDGIIESGRCVGSIPDNPNARNTALYSSDYEYFSKYNNQFEAGEEDASYNENHQINYKTDYQRMKALEINSEKKEYWLASRKPYSYSSGSGAMMRYTVDMRGVGGYNLFGVKSNGTTEMVTYSFGLRPVMKLMPEVTITQDGNDGTTADTAYNLE